MSDHEISEESGKDVALIAEVERSASSSVSRRSNRSEESLSYNSPYASKVETISDVEEEYESAFDDLIKSKKCSIMLLKRLNKSKEKCYNFKSAKLKWKRKTKHS